MDKVKIGGWKTKAAAAGFMLIGLGSMLQGAVSMIDGDFETGIATVKGGMASFAAGFGLIGLGHKAEKIKALLEK